jgi:hypothetical protein
LEFCCSWKSIFTARAQNVLHEIHYCTSPDGLPWSAVPVERCPGICGYSDYAMASASSLATGTAHTSIFRCPYRQTSRGFKSGVREGLAAVPPPHVRRSRQVLVRTPRTLRPKCATVPLCLPNSCNSQMKVSGRALISTFLLFWYVALVKLLVTAYVAAASYRLRCSC